MGSHARTPPSAWALALLLGLAQLHNVLLFSSGTLAANVAAAVGVTTGHPQWRTDQARILGPYLMRAVSALLHVEPRASYLLVFTVALGVAGILTWQLGRRTGDTRTAWLAMLTLHVLFFVARTRPWLFVWDSCGLVLFLLFVRFIVDDRPWPWFAALAVPAILNRESGLYIPVWLALDPLCRAWLRTPLAGRPAGPTLASGVVLGAGGAGVIEWLRTRLLVEEMMPRQLVSLPAGYSPHQHWGLDSNISALITAPQQEPLVMLARVKGLVLLLALLGAAAFLARLDRSRYLGLALTLAAACVGMTLFAFLYETRVFVEMLPFLVLAAALGAGAPAAPPAEPS